MRTQPEDVDALEDADSATLASAATQAQPPDTSSAGDTRQRHNKIQEAAYRRAETRGFDAGGELEDWLMAEREIDGKAE